MRFLDLPEEILVVILEFTILPLEPRLSLSKPQPLLTCRAIHRIGLPILYQTLFLRSSSNALLLECTLLERPTLVRHIRHLYSRVSTSWLLPVLRAIGQANGSLQTLDFLINSHLVGRQGDEEENLEPPLTAVPVRQLAARQGDIFFPPDRALVVADALARAIERWPNLEVVVLEPRMLLSSMPPGRPSPLAVALSRSPSLRFLRTALPPAWNSSLLIASENPSLRRIVLTRPQVFSSSDGLTSMNVEVSVPGLLAEEDVHPWLLEARKHRRLMELIGAT